MDEIRSLGHDAYLVHGKVIWIMNDAVDPSSEEGRKFLLVQAEQMTTGITWQTGNKDVTGAMVYPKSGSPDGTKYPVEPFHFNELPDDVRKKLKKEFPEYVDRI